MDSAMSPTILVAGATGTLGSQIIRQLIDLDSVTILALVRDATPPDGPKRDLLDSFRSAGVQVVEASLSDAAALERAVVGVDVVVSALQGGAEVVIDGQVALATAAKKAGATRIIPSDFALDIWAAPQKAPMFAMRREADARIDDIGLDVLHVLNGAFMDMLLDPATAGVIDLKHDAGNYYGAGDDEFDVTLIADVARFTARLAVDLSAPAGTYRISGSRTSYNDIIATVEDVTGKTLSRNLRGTVSELESATSAASNPWSVIGEWYNLSMITTPPFPETDNDRYLDAHPTALRSYLEAVLPASQGSR
jgi:uncharacterized protein YbjT (DUF2867 family)